MYGTKGFLFFVDFWVTLATGNKRKSRLVRIRSESLTASNDLPLRTDIN